MDAGVSTCSSNPPWSHRLTCNDEFRSKPKGLIAMAHRSTFSFTLWTGTYRNSKFTEKIRDRSWHCPVPHRSDSYLLIAPSRRVRYPDHPASHKWLIVTSTRNDNVPHL